FRCDQKVDLVVFRRRTFDTILLKYLALRRYRNRSPSGRLVDRHGRTADFPRIDGARRSWGQCVTWFDWAFGVDDARIMPAPIVRYESSNHQDSSSRKNGQNSTHVSLWANTRTLRGLDLVTVRSIQLRNFRS